MTPTETISTRKGVILMLLSVAFFTINGLIIRWLGLNAQIDGWLSSFARGVAGAAFVMILYGRGRGLELRKLKRPLMLLRGILGVAGITILYFTIIELGVGRAMVINLTYPLFGTIIATLVLREAVRRELTLLLIAAFAGLVIFFFDSLRDATFNQFDLLGLLGAVIAGSTVVVIRLLTRSESAPTIYSAQCFLTMLVAGPIAAPDILAGISPLIWTCLLGAGLIVAYGQILMTRGFYHLSIAQGSGLQMLLPVCSSVGGLILFNETFSPLEILGATTTLLATWRISALR